VEGKLKMGERGMRLSFIGHAMFIQTSRSLMLVGDSSARVKGEERKYPNDWL